MVVNRLNEQHFDAMGLTPKLLSLISQHIIERNLSKLFCCILVCLYRCVVCVVDVAVVSGAFLILSSQQT
jgi:hypothetical protein